MTPTQEQLEAAETVLNAEQGYSIDSEEADCVTKEVLWDKLVHKQAEITRQSRQIEELVKLAEEMICIHEHRRAPVSYAEAKGLRARLDSIRKGGA